jgi:NADH-quinone oxidoreductase subunit E
MAVRFSPAAEAKFEEIVRRYPVRRAAILPTLWLAQEEFGYISPEVTVYVAELLGLSPAFVGSVASFYTMFYKRPMGAFHVQVCTNLSCALVGADRILQCLERRLGITVGETTPDGAFSLSEVECLASCGTAPMMQINDDYWENLTPERTVEIIDRLAREHATRRSGGCG